MAVNSTTVTTTTSYVKIVDDGEDYVIQNVGPNKAEIVFNSSAVPAATVKGHIIGNGEGISSAIFGQSDVYVKSITGAATLIVTK